MLPMFDGAFSDLIETASFKVPIPWYRQTIIQLDTVDKIGKYK